MSNNWIKFSHSQANKIDETGKKIPIQTNKPFIKKESIQKKRLDPIQIILMCSIFLILSLTAYLMLSPLLLISLTFGTAIVMYELFRTKHSLLSKYSRKKYQISLFSSFLMILPFFIASLTALEGYSLWESVNRSVILWGLTVTFWTTMLFTPLAVYSKYKEEGLPEPTNYPSISIIIPAYNEEKVISHTIESLLDEKYPRKEIIFVDDGSIDKTLDIAKRYRDKIKILHKENGGKASALNYAMTYASGEIIVVIDADTIVGRNSLKSLIKGFQAGNNVAAVAGNIRVRNKINLLTQCQSLEYISGIQIMRRAFDYFGATVMVPGALGAFKKSVLEESGKYDKSTLVEDFDTTIKVLKLGFIVQGSSKSTSYTEVPTTLSDFFKQRKRWYRGNLQVVLRHSNALTMTRFGFLQRLAFPFMIISMLIIPVVGLIVVANAIFLIINGDWFFVLQIFLLFVALQYLQTALAIRIDGENFKSVLYSVFFVIGYKQLIDFLLIKAAFETLFKFKAKWTSPTRRGF